MRRSFTIAFALLVVAQVAVIAYWASRRPTPKTVRESLDGMIGSLRGWADKLERAAESEADHPGYAELLRRQAASDRKLADRLAADPEEGVAIAIAVYLQFHDDRRSALLRDRVSLYSPGEEPR